MQVRSRTKSQEFFINGRFQLQQEFMDHQRLYNCRFDSIIKHQTETRNAISIFKAKSEEHKSFLWYYIVLNDRKSLNNERLAVTTQQRHENLYQQHCDV